MAKRRSVEGEVGGGRGDGAVVVVVAAVAVVAVPLERVSDMAGCVEWV